MTTSAPPWSRPRSIAACATPRPIQTMISIVTEIEAETRSRCGIVTASTNTTGSEATRASSTCRSSPSVPATTSPTTPIIAASRTGRARSNMTESSCTQISASAPIPAAKTHSPCQMITIANATAGIATRIRGIRSDVPFLRGSREARRAPPMAQRPPNRRTRAS